MPASLFDKARTILQRVQEAEWDEGIGGDAKSQWRDIKTNIPIRSLAQNKDESYLLAFITAMALQQCPYLKAIIPTCSVAAEAEHEPSKADEAAFHTLQVAMYATSPTIAAATKTLTEDKSLTARIPLQQNIRELQTLGDALELIRDRESERWKREDNLYHLPLTLTHGAGDQSPLFREEYVARFNEVLKARYPAPAPQINIVRMPPREEEAKYKIPYRNVAEIRAEDAQKVLVETMGLNAKILGLESPATPPL